jgi:hypothetical protein
LRCRALEVDQLTGACCCNCNGFPCARGFICSCVRGEAEAGRSDGVAAKEEQPVKRAGRSGRGFDLVDEIGR